MSDQEQRGSFEHSFNRTSEDNLDNADKRGQADNRTIEVTEIARGLRERKNQSETEEQTKREKERGWRERREETKGR